MASFVGEDGNVPSVEGGMSSMSLDELKSAAAKQNMAVVDSNEMAALLEEADDVIEKAIALCEVIDPEATPYASKYKAREELDAIVRRIEANQTVCRLEGKQKAVAAASQKLASIRVRLAGISWDCEEPHNAETDLALAAAYYYPQLLEQISVICPDISTEEMKNNPELAAICSESESYEDLALPELPKLALWSDAPDATRCLNLLGILWAGRGQPRKSLIYLLLSLKQYEDFTHTVQSTDQISFTLSTSRDMDNYISRHARLSIESSHTHTLFYLAQAYGNLGNSELSAMYCHRTLQRQYQEGIQDVRSALDWVKNAAGLADFYIARTEWESAALALATAEKVFHDRVIPVCYEQLKTQLAKEGKSDLLKEKTREELQTSSFLAAEDPLPNYIQGNINAAEVEADIYRRWAVLNGLVLRHASSLNREKLAAIELEMDYEQIFKEMCKRSPTEDDRIKALTSSTSADGQQLVNFIEGVPVVLPQSFVPWAVDDFEKARVVFLRGAHAVEQAKRYYVLDGFVTDHCSILEEHSKLYHNLSTFETDPKRQLAMEARRHTMLLPVLQTLAIGPFEVLHKQISFQLGECALSQLDIKISSSKANGKVPKKSDVEKCNQFCHTALAMFTHFLSFYADQSQLGPQQHASKGIDHYLNMTLPVLALQFNENYDYTLVTDTECRAFFDAHFLSCRALTKVGLLPSAIPHPWDSSTFIPAPAYPLSAHPPYPTPRHAMAHCLICAQHRYAWISKLISQGSSSPSTPLGRVVASLVGEESLDEQITVCNDMASLLPSKIHRMITLGESGLDW